MERYTQCKLLSRRLASLKKPLISFFFMFSKDKRCLKSLEEELLKVYTELCNVENEKEEEFKRLQMEESQALACDNYDLAEEISNRMEQLKQDLEFTRYRLPARDDKVGKKGYFKYFGSFNPSSFKLPVIMIWQTLLFARTRNQFL